MRLYIISSICLLLSVAFAASKASARASFSPSIETGAQFNDNIYYSYKDKKNDLIVNAAPAMDINLSTERFSLSSATKYSYLRYMGHTDLSRSLENYNVEATTLFSQRISLQTTAEYKKDSTQESELSETGVVNVLAERYKFFGQGAAVYNISEKSDLILGYNHTSVSYEWDENADRKNDGLFLSVKRKLNDQKSEISFIFSSLTTVSDASSIKTTSSEFIEQDPTTGAIISKTILTNVLDTKQNNRTNNYGASVNFSRNISETTKVIAEIGARRTINGQHVKINKHTESETATQSGTTYLTFDKSDDSDESSNRWGGVFNFEFTYDIKKHYTKVGYSRDLTHDSYGDPIERDQVHFTTRNKTSERTALNFNARLGQTRSESDGRDAKNTYFSITPSFVYKLTKDATAKIWYQYSHSENAVDNNGDRVGARNLVCFTCSFNFPTQR